MTDIWRPGNHILGAGVVYFDDGDGERPIVEADQLAMLVEVERIERWGSIDGPLELLESAPTRVRRTLTIGTHDIIVENLALYFGGETSTPTMSSSYSATSTRANRWYQCTDIPAPFTVSSVTFANEVTPVEGTHYEVDEDLGRIQVLQDGLGQMDVTFSADDVDLLTIGQAQVAGGVRFLADNTVGAARNLWFPSCVIYPSDPIGWKSRSDYTRIGLTIEILGGPATSTRTRNGVSS